MPEKAAPLATTTPVVGDPDEAPVRTVDGVAFCGLFQGNISLVLTTNRGRFDADGSIRDEHVIASRLRIDPQTARSLRDFLDAQLSQLALMSAPRGVAN